MAIDPILLEKILLNHPDLTSLDLRDLILSDDDCFALIEALKENIQITEFFLHEEQLDNKTIVDSLSAYISRNKHLQEKYCQPLSNAIEQENSAAIMTLLGEMKTAFPDIDLAKTKQPQKLCDLYNKCIVILSSKFLDSAEIINFLLKLENRTARVNKAIIAFLLRLSIEPNSEQVKSIYRLILWLAIQNSEDDQQPLIRTYVNKVYNDPAKLSSSSQQKKFISYQQLLITAQHFIEAHKSTPYSNFEHRYQLFEYCFHQKIFDPNVVAILLCFPEITATFLLREKGELGIIDAEILNSAGFMPSPDSDLSKLLDILGESRPTKPEEYEHHAKRILQNIAIRNRTEKTTESYPTVEQVIQKDRETLLEIVKHKASAVPTSSLLSSASSIVPSSHAHDVNPSVQQKPTQTWANYFLQKLSNFTLHAVAERLRNNDFTLTSLEIVAKTISSAEMGLLCAGLRRNTTLTSLRFANNTTNPDDVDSLTRALEKHPTLTSLDLSARYPQNISAIGKLLTNNTKLTQLSLDSIMICSDLFTLSRALSNSMSLTLLKLSFRLFSTSSKYETHSNNSLIGASLCQALIKNTSLTSLQICNYPLEFVGSLEALIRSLETDTTLSTIQLEGTDGIEVGIKSDLLVRLLRSNSTLTSIKIDIEFDRFSDADEVAQIAEALRSNTTLTSLSIKLLNCPPRLVVPESTSRDQSVSQIFFNALQENISLFNLSINIDQSIDCKDVKLGTDLKELLNRNRMMRPLVKLLREASSTEKVVGFLVLMKQAYPDIDSPLSSQPKALTAIYAHYYRKLFSSVLSHKVIHNLMWYREHLDKLYEPVVEYLLAISFDESSGELNKAKYRVMLWLLRNELNSGKQRIVSLCIAKLLGEDYKIDLELNKPHAFICYHQLLAAANNVLNQLSANTSLRYQLLRYCIDTVNYTPCTAQYLLKLPEIRSNLGLNDNDDPQIIDPVILYSSGKLELSKLSEDMRFKNFSVDELERHLQESLKAFKTESSKSSYLSLFWRTNNQATLLTKPTDQIEEIISKDINELKKAIGSLEEEYVQCPISPLSSAAAAIPSSESSAAAAAIPSDEPKITSSSSSSSARTIFLLSSSSGKNTTDQAYSSDSSKMKP